MRHTNTDILVVVFLWLCLLFVAESYMETKAELEVVTASVDRLIESRDFWRQSALSLISANQKEHQR